MRRALVAASVVALLAAGYVLGHLRLVHERSYEYRWSPSAAAPKVQFRGRDYLRSSLPSAGAPPADEVPLGRTEGGGRVYGLPGERRTQTVLHVAADGRVWTYALSGGP